MKKLLLIGSVALMGFVLPACHNTAVPEPIVDTSINDDLTKRGSHQGPTGAHPCSLVLQSSHDSNGCTTCVKYNKDMARNADVNQQGSHQGPVDVEKVKGYAAPDWRKIPESSFNCPTYKANPKPPHDRTQCHHCATKLNEFGYKVLIPVK